MAASTAEHLAWLSTQDEQTRLADRTLIGYAEFAELIGVKPQSLRAAMQRRRQHEREEGKARVTDLLAPAVERFKWPRTQPLWLYGEALEWALRVGKLKEDGVTPNPYRGSDRKRKEFREAQLGRAA